MPISSAGYGASGARQFSNESLERLARHDLFDFQIQHAAVSTRVAELQEMLHCGRSENDLPELLGELIHELEDLIFDAGENVTFLLASLQHFRQQMELYLELDQEARLTASGMTKNIFSAPKSGSKKNAVASPVRKAAVSSASRSPARKHAKPEQQQPQQASRSADDDIVCGVCLQADSLEHDPIVICDLCSVAVHQSCYRIEDLPEDDWFCRPCQRYLHAKDVGSNVTPTYELQCEACHEKGGAFIATVDDKWVHMACSMFLPELYVQTSHKHNGEEVIGGIEQLGERRKLRCNYCKKKNRGACAQCVVGKCTTSYHVLCALKHNLKFVFMEDKGQFGSGCARHQKQFCGEEYHGVTTDEEVATRAIQAPKQRHTPPTSPHPRTGAKGKKKLPRRQNSVSSESSDGGDGVVLDEESDNSSMFSSDVDSEHHSTPRRKSPGRVVKRDRSPQAQRASPGKQKSPSRAGRPAKKQQTLMVPSYGIVKQLTKPMLPSTSSQLQKQPLLPIPTPSTAKPTNKPAPMHTATQLFIPVSGNVLKTGFFEDLLLIIPTMPLGISVRTEERGSGKVMLLQGQLAQQNAVVIDALRSGILHDGDEMLAVNDISLRKRETGTLKAFLGELTPPYRFWIKLNVKRSITSLGLAPVPTLGVQPVQPTLLSKPPPPTKPAAPVKLAIQTTIDAKSQQEKSNGSSTDSATDEPKPARGSDKGSDKSADRTPMEEALSVDWPWFYLRSDGKIAMNLMWKSLEAGFFVQKFNSSTWNELFGKVEALVGLRLSRTHPEYPSTTQDLLRFPSRERPVPVYIQEYRQNQKQKKRHLANDSVFLGSDLEQVAQDEEWDNLPPLAIGATVQVAKRTWPGINKLGGAGRVRKVHEETSEDGEKKRYLYDIAYILGGSEKKVERKWIQVVTSLTGDGEDASNKSQPEAPASKKPDATEVAEPENEDVQLRFGLQLEVSDKEAQLPDVVRSTEPKVHLQVSVMKNSISLQRDIQDSDGNGDAVKREMLWHVHFPVKQSGADALLSESLAGNLEYFVERGEDEDEDAEDDASEVSKQLLEAQAQFKLVMARNEALFASLKEAVDQEYASKQYRKRKLDEIQAKHYNEMYREMAAARKAFDESDDDSGDEATVGVRDSQSRSGGRARAQSNESSDSESDQDESCGGMFINKIKQEGNEVCVLCELTGGDFAATSSGGVVHPQCAMYTPETFFKNGVAHGLDKIPADERRALSCQICGGKKGISKIQCANQRCLTAYHVACAYVNGLLTRDPHYQAWCPKHLKSSGMQGEIEWPPHLRPRKVETSSNNTPAKSPPRGSKRGGAISSSKSNSQRKRRRSNTSDSTDVLVVDVDADGEDSSDRNLARRLVIDDDSDEGFDVSVVFKKGDVVQVRARDGPGINKPGGVARVTQVTELSEGTFVYDVSYILDNAKEKQVEAKYLRAYSPDQPGGDGNEQPKKRRSAA